MKKWIETVIVAFSMYSKLPMPHVNWTKENMRYTLCFFPLIGCVIGLLNWGWLALSLKLGFSSLLVIAVWILIPVLITGGIHLDGLLDTADALSSWQERERRLEILKDSHAGAFAIIVCCGYFVATLGVWSMMSPKALFVMGVGYCLSRALSGYGVTAIPCAKGSGLAYTFAQASDKAKCKKILAIEVIISSAGMILIDPKLGICGVCAAIVVFFFVRRMAMKTFGGTTGDIQGFFLQLCELFMAAAIVIGGAV